MNFSEYYQIGYLIWSKRPTITLSNITQVGMTYNDHSHPIQANVNNSAKILDIKLKFSTITRTPMLAAQAIAFKWQLLYN